MNKDIFSVLMIFFSSIIFAQEGPRLIEISAKQTPNAGQSLYVFSVTHLFDGKSVVLTIDDVEIGHFFNGETAEIAVSNGRHVVKAYQKKWNSRKGIWEDDGNDRLTDTLEGVRFPVVVSSGPSLSGGKQTTIGRQSLYAFTVKMRSGKSVVLTIDDVEIGHFSDGETAEIVVPDGSHVVKAYQKKWNSRSSIWEDDGNDRLTDTLEGVRFPVEVSNGPKLSGGRKTTLRGAAQASQPGTTTTATATARTTTAAAAQQPRQALGSASGIEGAVARASLLFVGELRKGATVAVISISSNNSDLATFAIDELEYQLVTAKQFTIVDRKTLDAIRLEQNFQLSGEVSDSSAVSIGNMLGANFVITGTIAGSGNTQRLTLKALDVKTAQIVSMAREAF